MSYRMDSVGLMAAEALEHYQARRLGEAEVLYRRILEQDPEHAEALGMMGVLALEARVYGEAERFLRMSLEKDGRSVGTLNNLGIVMRQTGRLKEAVGLYKRAVEMEPHYLPLLVTLGSGLRDLGQMEEAEGMYQRALAIDANYAEAHLGLASIYLRKGELLRGWPEYEWRKKYKVFAAEHEEQTQPKWAGEPLAGRTVLVHAEQGFGDTLNFIRYAPLVGECGGRVVVLCQPELKELLSGSVVGVDAWVGVGEELPWFDFQVSLLSLPGIFETTMELIPEPELVRARAEDVEKWKKILADDGDGLRVGLCWSGNPRQVNDPYRSMALETLRPLADVKGVNFYSLQKDARESDRKLPLPICFFDYTEELKSFSDTAGLVANLDLVISVCTSTAHLAGVMGKKTWVMVSAVPDWRWFEKREDSPWYPAARLFRQEVQGEWKPVVEKVREELVRLVQAPRV